MISTSFILILYLLKNGLLLIQKLNPNLGFNTSIFLYVLCVAKFLSIPKFEKQARFPQTSFFSFVGYIPNGIKKIIRAISINWHLGQNQSVNHCRLDVLMS